MYKVPTITRYAVMHDSCEIPGRSIPADVDELFDRYLPLNDRCEMSIGVFDDVESARAELAKHRCSAWKPGSIISAELFWIESGTYDAQDGEFLDGGDIWDYAKYDV